MTETDEIMRTLPHAVGPEKSILSTMLQDPKDYIGEAIEANLSASDFYLPSHATLFSFIIDLFETGQEIELVSLTQRLLDSGKLDRIGGPAALSDIYGYSPTPTHFQAHVRLVKDKALLREIIRFGNEAVIEAYEAPGEASEVLGMVERKITAIAAEAAGGRKNRTLGSIIRESIEGFEARVRTEIAGTGIPTGTLLDQHIGGLHQGRVYVVCAYPKGGKSVLASQIITNVAIDEGLPAMFLTMEMTEREIMDRMIIQSGRLPAEAFTNPRAYAAKSGSGTMTNEMQRVITGSAAKVSQSKLSVVRPGNRNIATICSAVRRAHREIGIRVAAVDFAQLIKAPGKTGVDEVEHISHTIHELAQELEIAIILPSQLNQDGDTKNGRVIEEDAAAVLNIVQDRNKDSETYRMHRHILVVADRFYGSDGERIPMILDKERIRFVEGRDETAKAQKPQFKR
jgi:replicative DNA helicase